MSGYKESFEEIIRFITRKDRPNNDLLRKYNVVIGGTNTKVYFLVYPKKKYKKAYT